MEVQSRVPNAAWRHVPTQDNPADCASRGLLGDELCSHHLWWRGSPWLYQPAHSWPQSDPPSIVDPLPEARPTILLAHPEPDALAIALRFSSWPRLLRVTAYIRRFIARCKRQSGQQSHDGQAAILQLECSSARTFWIQRLQSVLFPAEVQCLKTDRSLPAKSLLLPLRPFIDSDGVLRVGGQLSRASIPFASRRPIILASHPMVTLIVRNVHQRVLHAGLQLTLSTLRRDFWILRARSVVRSILFKCVACARERAATPSQLMEDLPAVRVSAPTRCFLHCGLDYAGPISVRTSPSRGVASQKSYVVLFVCLATRAVHIELDSDYS